MKNNDEGVLKSNNKLINEVNLFNTKKSHKKKHSSKLKLKNKNNENIYKENKLNNELDKNNSNEKKENKNIIKTENKTEKIKNPNIIDKIEVNKACICFCFLCTKKRKTIENTLLEEGMNIIIENLDILNIFKKLFRDGKLQEKLDKVNVDILRMSDKCNNKLYSIKKSISNN